MILFWYLGMLLVVLASLFLRTPDVLSIYHVGTFEPVAYTALCTLFFVLGYFALRLHMPYSEIPVEAQSELPPVSSKTLLSLVLLAFSGLAILLLQIIATVGLPQYFAMLAVPELASDLRYQTVMLSSSEGGYPGYIKMFNCNASVGVMVLLALIAMGRHVRGFRNVVLVLVLFIIYAATTVLRMDRLSIMLLAPVVLSICARRELKSVRVLAFIFGALLIIAIAIQSLRRDPDRGLLSWMALYFQLGTVNLGMLMRYGTAHTYGLAGILSVLNWILKSVGIDMMPSSDAFRWAWNPAQNGFGYMYLDFGWLGCAAMTILGLVAGWIDVMVERRSRHGTNKAVWRTIQWIVCYGIASMAVVPAFSGIEFWLILLMSAVIVKATTKSSEETA